MDRRRNSTIHCIVYAPSDHHLINYPSFRCQQAWCWSRLPQRWHCRRLSRLGHEVEIRPRNVTTWTYRIVLSNVGSATNEMHLLWAVIAKLVSGSLRHISRYIRSIFQRETNSLNTWRLCDFMYVAAISLERKLKSVLERLAVETRKYYSAL